MAVNVGEVYAVLGLDRDKFDSSLASADAKFDSFGAGLTSKAASFAKAAGAALVISGAGLAAIGVAGTKAYADVESAAADAASKMDLSAIAQKSGESMGQAFTGVKQHVIDLSRELGQLSTNSFDPTQIAGAMANLAAGGMDVANASAKDLAPVLALATAANYDLQSSAEVSLSTMNMYGMKIQDLGHISDVYTLASGKSAAGMSDFKEAMSYVGPAAQNANVSLEESVAMIGKLRDVGIPASTVGTSLRDGMQTLVAPTDQAAKHLGEMGLTTADVNLKNQKFIDVLVKMKTQADKTGEGAAAFIKVFGVTGDTLYNLAGMAPGVDTLTNSLENSTGAAEEMAGFMNNTLMGAWNTAMGAAVDLGIGIGERLTPTLENVFKWFSDSGAPAIASFIDAIANGDWDSVGKKLSEGFTSAFDYISSVGTSIWETISEPAITAFELIAGAAGIGLVTVGLISYGPLFVTVGRSFASMALTGVASFVKIAGAATGSAIVTGLTSIVGFTSTAAKGFLTVGVSATSAFLSAKLSAVSSYTAMISASVSARLAFISTWAAAIGPIAGVVAGISAVAVGIGAIGYSLNPGKFVTFNQVAIDAFNGIKDTAKLVVSDILAGDWGKAATDLKTSFVGAVEYIKNVKWSALGSEVVTMIGDGARAIVNSAVDLGTWIYNVLNDWTESGGPENLGETVAKYVIDGFKSLIGEWDNASIWDTMSKIMGSVNDWLQLGWDIASGIGTGLYKAIEPYLVDMYNGIVDFAADSTVAMIGFKESTISTISSAFETCKTKIDEVVTAIGQKINIDASWETFKGYLEKASDAMTNLSKYLTMTFEVNFGDWNSFWNKLGGIQDRIKHIFDTKVPEEEENTPQTNPDGWVSFDQGYASVQTVKNNQYSISDSRIGSLLYEMNIPETKSENSQVLKILSTGDVWNNGEVERYEGTDLSLNELQSKGFTKGTLGSVEKTSDNTEAIAKNTATINENTDATKISYTKISGDVVQWSKSQIEAYEYIESFRKNYVKDEDKINQDKLKTSEDVNKNVKSMMGGVVEPGFKSITLQFKQGVESGSDSLKSGSNYASNSLKSGASLIETGGQRIAVIGSVAQAQFAAAGGKWISDASSSGSLLMGYTTNGGKNAENSLTFGSVKIENAGSGFFNNATSGGKKIEDAATGFFDKIDSSGKNLVSSLSSLENVFSKAGLIIQGKSSGLANGSNSDGAAVAANGVTNVNTNGSVNGNFEDMTCLGDTVLVNGLVYTSPSGQQTTINPMTYIGSGGISKYQTKGQTKISASNDAWDISSGTGEESKATTTAVADVNKLTNNANQKLTVLSTTTNELASSNVNAAKTSAIISTNAAQKNAVLTTDSGAKFNALSDEAAIAQAKSAKGSANYYSMKMNGMTDREIIEQEKMLYNKTANEANVEGNWLSCVGGSGDDWQANVNEAETSSTNANNARNSNSTNNANSIDANHKATSDLAGKTTTDSATTAGKSITDAGDSLNSSINSAVTALAATVEGMTTMNIKIGETITTIGVMTSNIMGLANRGGGDVWGGTSISGGGSWIGKGSTAVGGVGYVNWGGTAASIAALGSNYSAPVSSSYSGISGFSNSFWAARGGLFDNGPELIGIGEAGTEAVLPSDITKTLMVLTAMGLGQMEDQRSARVNLPYNQMMQILSNSGSKAVNHKEIKENMNITLVIEMNGKQMAKEIMPFAFGEIKRAGLKLKH